MSRIGERLAAMVRRNHVSESRLSEFAGTDGAATISTAEQAHLDACTRCRALLVGYSRAEAVLSGAWIDRPVRPATGSSGIAGPDRVVRVRVGRSGRRGVARRAAIPVGLAAVLIGVIATAGLLTLRSGGLRPASSGAQGSTAAATPQTSAHGTPERSGLVARLPLGQYGSFSWAPDGGHLLVSDGDQYVTRVYDRSGKLVSQFGSIEGWLDATHVIDGAGYVTDIAQSHSGGPTANSRVVANGHGSAAIIVAVPGCIGDPIIDWYRDGKYVKAGEKATPYGWSADGKLLLLGHMSCTVEEAQLHGWKGPVDVVDFATGRVVATAPAVRGAMAFNPSGTRLAAESDKDLEIVDFATGKVKTVPGARLAGWADDDRLYCLTTSGSLTLVGATAEIPPLDVVIFENWAISSPAGPVLEVDKAGVPVRIASADRKTTLLDLSATSLVARLDLAAAVSSDQPRYSALLQNPWSPDGRLLALKSSDGTSVALISVTDLPGSVAGALPTPIGSPQAIAQLDLAVLPGPVGGLVADAQRNAFWFLGGDTRKAIELYRYDVAAAKLAGTPLAGTVYDPARDRLAVAPDGKLWIGAGRDLIVYDPESGSHANVALPATGPDVQVDPKLGKTDPWVAGIAFDAKNGKALIARNWVRSLALVDAASLRVTGAVEVSDGFAMTGGVVFAGGRVFVVADPETGFGFGVDAGGTQTLSNIKFTAPAIAEWGDRLLTAGTPPGFIGSDGGGSALIEPVPTTADLVATGPNGVAVLYDAKAGEIQWRDAQGQVSAQGMFPAGTAPHVVALAFDGRGRLWAVESADGVYSLVRLDFAP